MSRYRLLSLSILFLWALFWGCDHRTYYKPPATGRHYTPAQIPIKEGMIRKPDVAFSPEITLVNAQPNTDWTPLGAYTHQWWGNLRMWTETAIGVARAEFKKRGVKVTNDLPLMLTLSVTPAPTSDTLVGTVSRECPLDKDKRQEHPLDTDRDGIPDYVDRCPNTPPGVRVNSEGCPVDTDHDSLPDYRDQCPRTPQGYRIDHVPLARQGEDGSGGVQQAPSYPFELFLVSSWPADKVMGLLRQAVEREGIRVEKHTPGILVFSADPHVWKDRLPTIRTALEREGVHLTKHAPRILQLAITEASLEWGSTEIGCTVNLRAVTGEGEVLDFRGTNYATDIHDSCDGAVTRQVAALETRMTTGFRMRWTNAPVRRAG